MRTLYSFIERLFLKKPDIKSVAVTEPVIKKPIDKVGDFNMQAPRLFSKRLSELGYHIYSFETSIWKEYLWSCKHIYFNEGLNLFLNVEQAPYYTDYGFSVFIHNPKLNDRKLICHVPHELQDQEGIYLGKTIDAFFANKDVQQLLKGEQWRPIDPVKYMI